jgi:hypothetical protein
MKRALVIALALALCAALRAQDSDPFFAGRAPLLLDPSRAGFSPGVSASFIHQDQWLQFPGAWRSDVLSAEFCARNTRKSVDAWFGVGFLAALDRQGMVGSRLSSVGLAPAMHLRAGQRSYLSAGLEVRWANRVLGDGTGAWGSQYNGLRYDGSLASGEVWGSDAQSWVEARAGLSWTLKHDAESARRRERDILVLGVAADHLGMLLLQEGGVPPPIIPMRFTAYALAEIPHEIWDNGFFAGEVIGHVQGPFHTSRLNVYAGKHQLNSVRTEGGPMLIGFKAGLGYRLQDALLVNASIDVGKTTFGMAYGTSLINRNTLAAGRRTFELMVQFRGGR